MEDKVNSIEIKLTNMDGKTKAFAWRFTEPNITISDKLIKPLMSEVGFTEIKACNINLGVVNTAVIIENYTFSDTIYIGGFYDYPSQISILKSLETNVHIVDQTIKKIQVDCAKILLGHCNISELDIGLAQNMELIKKHSDGDDINSASVFEVESVDLRDCFIKTISIYAKAKSISIRTGHIQNLNVNGYGIKEISSVIEKINIWLYSQIDNFELHCKTDELKVTESTISNIVAKANCFIEKLSVSDSSFYNAHKFRISNFKEMSYDAWFLVSKSAEHERNLWLRAEANFQMAKSNARTEKGFGNILISKLFGFCAGYGYKPTKIFLATFVVIITSTIAKYIIDLCNKVQGNTVGDNLLFSLSALVGQSGVSTTDGAIFWIAVLESLIGLILFAMFVNALYLRYKD